jgi:hypothetical protein
MIVIYQIGDVQVYNNILGEGTNGLKLTRPISWDNPQAEITDVESVVSLLPATTSLATPNSIKLKGMVFSSLNQSIDALMERLKYVSGRRNTQVIGFMMQSVPNGEKVLEISDLLWLENDCVISNVQNTSVWASGNSDAGLDISFTIELGLTWGGLSDLYWEYRNPELRYINPYDPNHAPLIPQERFILPKTFGEIVPDNFFFRWDNELSAMSPTVWDNLYTGNMNGQGSDFDNFGSFSVFADPDRWQSVRSMYAFTGLSSSGTISISVCKAGGYFPGDELVEISSLDLSVLDAALATAGYVGLKETDILYTGLVDPLPSYVVRDGERITELIAEWDYDSTYPGEVGKGYSDVTVAGEDTLGSVAFVHEFRLY